MPDITGAYNWAIRTCEDPNVGYSQAYRCQETVDGITYYDCSSFIWYALKDGGGFDVVAANNGNDYPFTTFTMEPVLINLGFVKYDACTVMWEPGDIVTAAEHCEMVYESTGEIGTGRTMGAHTDTVPLPDQVSINGINGCNAFPNIFKYSGGGVIPGRRRRGLKIWQMIRYHI